MRYANVSFRVKEEEKEGLRELAEERGITMSKLCGEIVKKHCTNCGDLPGRQILGEADLEAIAEAVADRLAMGGGGGELPGSETLESYIRTAVEATDLSRGEIIGRLLSYAIKNVAPQPHFLMLSIDSIKNKLWKS